MVFNRLHFLERFQTLQGQRDRGLPQRHAADNQRPTVSAEARSEKLREAGLCAQRGDLADAVGGKTPQDLVHRFDTDVRAAGSGEQPLDAQTGQIDHDDAGYGGFAGRRNVHRLGGKFEYRVAVVLTVLLQRGVVAPQRHLSVRSSSSTGITHTAAGVSHEVTFFDQTEHVLRGSDDLLG